MRGRRCRSRGSSYWGDGVVLDFNKVILSESEISLAINELIEQAAIREVEAPRPYLGASVAGGVCQRQIQYDWLVTPRHPARLKDIFARGHFFETRTREHLIACGFRFAPANELAFRAADGQFRGHADGIIVSGPTLPGVGYPCLWEHKCVNSRGWRKLERDGLAKAYPTYAGQVSLYQSYLGVAEHPAIFTAMNADTCERLWLLVPFDAERAQAASDNAATIIKATRAGELLARFTDNPKDWRCNFCSHAIRCWSTP
jgi:hypothetical protein